MTDLKALTTEIEIIAREAGSFIRNEVNKFDISKAEVKGLNNFVSYVDKSAEQIIVNRLRVLIPDAGFSTEEGTATSDGKRYLWVIDPLDGTTNFMHGCPPFAVSIALKEYGDEVAGVVYEITADEMFTAWKKGGAWLNGKPIHVSAAAKLSESLVATGF